MDSYVGDTTLSIAREPVQHVTGWRSPPAVASVAEREAIMLLMRDGSRLRVMLADPLRQAPELAAALAPIGARPDTITLDLDDGSRLMLATSEILGLHLPPEQVATPTTLSPVAQDDTRVHNVGTNRVVRISNFLAPDVVVNLYRYVLSKQAEFKASSVLSNDPEYRKSVVLFKFPEYEAMFHNMLRATLPQISDALGVPRFELGSFECQLTATSDKGYFKPHNDNAASLAHRKITYVYYFHRVPTPFTGGEIRFFDHNPFAVDVAAARHVLDLSPINNSIVFFDSACFHEVRDTICANPAFENSRFTINGWLGLPKPK